MPEYIRRLNSPVWHISREPGGRPKCAATIKLGPGDVERKEALGEREWQGVCPLCAKAGRDWSVSRPKEPPRFACTGPATQDRLLRQQRIGEYESEHTRERRRAAERARGKL